MWLLIDGNNWFAADWYAAKRDAPDIFCRRLRDVVALVHANGPLARIAVAFDSAESFRREILPNYKAHRRQKDDGYFFLLTQVQNRLRDLAYGGLPVECICRDGFEADDVLAALTWHAQQEGESVVICSADRDLHALLVDGAVTQATKFHRSTPQSVRANWMTAAKLREQYGVWAHQWIDYRCIVGDGSDGLAGCPEVGPVAAREVLRVCTTLDDFFANPFRPKISANKRARLLNFRDAVPQLRQLIGLRDDCLDAAAGARA